MQYSLEIREQVSKKTGNTYKALFITFPNGYEKMVFLEPAELFMFENLLEKK